MPYKASFWQVGLLGVALSEYAGKSHNFTNLIFYDVTLKYSIPPKFEHKLRRQKQSFGKIATTVVLDEDENLL